jgi:hypothetical protein
VIKQIAKLLALRVGTDDTDLCGHAAEGDNIAGRVCGPAEDDLAADKLKDGHRCLAREAGGSAEEVLVEGHIANDEDALTGEARDKMGEGLGH